uniref:Uncharacterized protein n=1 Tax=Anguilla anguilla TaxID=7936 RepID=A0A0E9W105_ANGAN
MNGSQSVMQKHGNLEKGDNTDFFICINSQW